MSSEFRPNSRYTWWGWHDRNGHGMGVHLPIKKGIICTWGEVFLSLGAKTSVCTYLSVSPGVRMIQLSDIIIGTSRCREKYFYSTTHDVRNLPGNPSKSASLMSGSEAENLRNRLGFRCRYSKYLANNCGPKNRETVKNNEPLACRESVTSLCKTLGCYLYL